MKERVKERICELVNGIEQLKKEFNFQKEKEEARGEK